MATSKIKANEIIKHGDVAVANTTDGHIDWVQIGKLVIASFRNVNLAYTINANTYLTNDAMPAPSSEYPLYFRIGSAASPSTNTTVYLRFLTTGLVFSPYGISAGYFIQGTFMYLAA